MLTNCLAACAHLTITVSGIERDNCEIDKTRRTVSAVATRTKMGCGIRIFCISSIAVS